MANRFLAPRTLKQPRIALLLVLLLAATTLSLSVFAEPPLAWLSKGLTWQLGVIALALLLATGLLASPWLGDALRRYQRTRRYDLESGVTAGEIPVLGALLFAIAALASFSSVPLSRWQALNILFDGAILALLAPGVLAAHRRRQIVDLPPPPVDEDDRDDPISLPDQDLLEREDFVTRWIEDIRSLGRERPYIYGLFGRQGSGKTSVLNLLRGRIAAETPEDFLVVEFDPWHFQGHQALTDSFYAIIQAAVDRRYFLPNLRRLLARYSATLQAGVPWASRLEFGVKGGEQSIDVLKERIRSTLRRIPERLLLVVDDLERVSGDDLATVVRLVRLTSDFPNLVIIISCDPMRLRPVSEDEYSTAALLEKSVQSILTVDPASREALDRYLYLSSGPGETPIRLSRIDRLFNDWGIPRERIEAFEKDFTPYYYFEFRFGFRNLRDCKRYIASLRFSLRGVWPEVNLFDYLLLEYLKVFAHDVWVDLWENSSRWIGSDLRRGFGLQEFTWGEEEDLANLKRHVETLIKDPQPLVLSILKKLLPRAAAALTAGTPRYSSDATRLQRLQSWEHFTKYFRHIVEKGDIPDQEMQRIIDEINAADTPETSREISRRNVARHRELGLLKRFLEKLFFLREELTAERRSEMARAIALESHTYSLTGWRDADSEFDRARRFVLEVIEESWEAGGRPLLASVVADSPRLSFSFAALRYTQSIPGSSYPGLRSEDAFQELRPIAIRRLEDRYVASAADVFEDEQANAIFVLLMWSRLAGQGAVQAYLDSLIERNPNYWARIGSAFIDPLGGLNVKELADLIDPTWFLGLAEKIRTAIDGDPEARRVLALLTTGLKQIT